MAPSRKKGGGKAASAASVRRQWKVGDLVLAKVKGFPAWPAAVSEPEKWGYAADWKKVLVHFFGTQQIAFCNPVDVESFTEEKKQSLLTKRHAKGSDFVRAIKEITESYEKLKQQDQANDPNSAEEITVGSSGNTVELPQTFENRIGARLDTRDELTLLSEDALAAEQMLALRHSSLGRNGACDSAVAKDLCEIATYSEKRGYERGRSQKCAPQKIIAPVQCSKISSRLELDRLQCNDGGQSVYGIYDGAITRRKRIRRSGHSESDDVVSSAPNLHGSDEENASEIATVESDDNSRNDVDSGSQFEHSDAVSEGCEGGHEINKGLDFQISTVVKRKKRKPTRKRETSDLIDPPAKVEADAGDSCQRSQNSHERVNERPCEKNGDEHLPLAKRARVRMSRAFYADENVNASSQLDERSSKDTLVSAPEQTSPSVNHENDIVSGRDTSAAEEYNSFELSAKLQDDMVDVVPSHIEKPFDRMSPSRSCVHTVGDKQTAIEFHDNECSMTPDDEVTRAQSNQRSSLPEREAHVPEVVQRCSEESQTRNCLNSESNPADVQCSRQSEKDGTFLNLDTVDSSADKALGLDMRASWVPSQTAHQQQSQENDPCDHSLITVGDSLNEKCEKIDCHLTEVIQPQAVECSPLFCSVINNQEAENTDLKEKQGSRGKELDRDKQAHMIQNPVLSVTESDMIVEEAEPQREPVHSHCEDAVENRELEKSCEADEQKEQIQATNFISVSENHSRDKMSISPANVAGSPARSSPHSNTVCHGSSTESAKVMQNRGNCSTKGEKKLRSDDTVKEETKEEKGVTQVKKAVSSDVHLTIESFETALGSLVRTKETIGRATRLAMDLVKFGASAKEAMEILARSLESETNLQRRVDLFFLVDSIAQCSKGVNGEGGGVYLWWIQVMLPRLLAAAVPAGATTEENRRQCLKVLRLWLERRILPETIIRQHIRELDSHTSSNNKEVPACLYSRRSARTERALDDPVRDMEGMLMDEYGSNSTLQLTGFCIPSRMVKDDSSGSDGGGGFEAVTPEHESRRHDNTRRLLEDVEGEVEMEDVAPRPESSWSRPRGGDSSRPYHPHRREGPSSSSSYPHRSFDERNYYPHRPQDQDRDNWRYHHHHHGPRYHDRLKGPYNGFYHHHHHRDSGRYQNQRWSHSPHSSFHFNKPHSQLPLAMRDPGSWHPR